MTRTMKGAVDVISSFCSLSAEDLRAIEAKVAQYSNDGCRSLAVARCIRSKRGNQKITVNMWWDFVELSCVGGSLEFSDSRALKGEYEFVGLVALADPPREDSKVSSSLQFPPSRSYGVYVTLGCDRGLAEARHSSDHAHWRLLSHCQEDCRGGPSSHVFSSAFFIIFLLLIIIFPRPISSSARAMC